MGKEDFGVSHRLVCFLLFDPVSRMSPSAEANMCLFSNRWAYCRQRRLCGGSCRLFEKGNWSGQRLKKYSSTELRDCAIRRIVTRALCWDILLLFFGSCSFHPGPWKHVYNSTLARQTGALHSVGRRWQKVTGFFVVRDGFDDHLLLLLLKL